MCWQRFAFDGNSEFSLNMSIAERQIWPDPGVCPCVFLQPHVHGHARRPEDEQPHGDEHHAGGLPRRPQNQRGVPDAFTEGLRAFTVARTTLQTASGSASHLKPKAQAKPLEAGSGYLNQDPSLGLTSKHWRLMNFSPAAEIIDITGNVRFASSVPSVDISRI